MSEGSSAAWYPAKLSCDTASTLVWIAFGFGLAGICCVAAAVKPRLRTGPPSGDPHYFADVEAYRPRLWQRRSRRRLMKEGRAEFHRALQGIDTDGKRAERVEDQIWALSHIAYRKYRLVTMGMWAFACWGRRGGCSCVGDRAAMGLKADLEKRVNDILSVAWNVRDGQVVPETLDVNLLNGAVKLEAAYLYADLADSTTLARDFDRRTAARVVRSYLHVMSRLVTQYGGSIRSFDGDRVMGIFIGDSKRSNAAKCCLKMNWAFLNIVQPSIEAKYPSLKTGGYTVEHSAGVDVGEVLMVRAGVRGSNDLVSIGAAPNIAATLSDLRETPYRSFITKAVYVQLAADSKLSDGVDMWNARTMSVKGKTVTFYRSSYTWAMG